jgi:hypothetical protein
MSKTHSSETQPNPNNNLDSEDNNGLCSDSGTPHNGVTSTSATKDKEPPGVTLKKVPRSPRVTSPASPRSPSGPSSRTRIFTPSKRSASLTSSHQLGAVQGKTDLLQNQKSPRPPGVPPPVPRRRSTPVDSTSSPSPKGVVDNEKLERNTLSSAEKSPVRGHNPGSTRSSRTLPNTYHSRCSSPGNQASRGNASKGR